MNSIHKDCFAYRDSSDKGCTILKSLYCKCGKCKFYKKNREGEYPHILSDREKFNNKVRGIEI